MSQVVMLPSWRVSGPRVVLDDDFSGGVLQPWWSDASSGDAALTVDGDLVITLPSSPGGGGAYGQCRSTEAYDLSAPGSYFQARLRQRLTSASDQVRPETYLRVYIDSPNYLLFGVRAGSASNRGLIVYASVAGVFSGYLHESTYSDTDHAWLRLEVSEDSILCRTAPDSGGEPGTWTTRYTYAIPGGWDLSAAHAELSAGAYSVTLTQNVARWDNATVFGSD